MTPVVAEPVPQTYVSLASLVDVHLLDPFRSPDEVYEACQAARGWQVRAVVVRPCDFEQAVQWMSGSGIAVVPVAGGPAGVSNTAVKLYELRDLLRLGAKEVEFVLSPARLKARQFQHIETELLQAAKSCHEDGARLTVVYHSTHLGDDLKIITTKICRRTEVDVIALDGGAVELALITPMLKDVLRMKLATPVETLDDALAARDAAYASFAVTDPAPLLSAWKARLAELAEAAKKQS